ncbi:MAG TPA: ORF6N domain-containing protein [Bryobacteraceae bacterium]|nr:ORF6N domain-containing protein [Bryobacteraceae bacterium]
MPTKTSKKTRKIEIVSLDGIERRILALRGHSVMFDRDLAALYGVETRTLNQAVKRNLDRFPSDFMFRLTPKEAAHLSSRSQPSRSQSVILKRGENVKYLPYVFTEHGAVMLANVLKSAPAVRASIQVVRAFVRIRQRAVTHELLAKQLAKLAGKVGDHDIELRQVFKTLRAILDPPSRPKRAIGFLAQRA